MTAAMRISAIAPWFGSKRVLAPKIVEQLGQHRCFWEPFCGSMAVLLAKPTVSQETVNDLHGDRPVPDGMEVCHRCDNPSCVRPHHLFVGTSSDNKCDCVSKGRFVPMIPPGGRGFRCMFSDDHVRVIRQRVAAGPKGMMAKIAREVGVHRSAIRNIVNRKSYQYVS